MRRCKRPEPTAVVAHGAVGGVLEPVLLAEPRPRPAALREQVGDAVGAAELERDEVVDLVLAGPVVADAVLAVDGVLGRLGDVADQGRVAGPADQPAWSLWGSRRPGVQAGSGSAPRSRQRRAFVRGWKSTEWPSLGFAGAERRRGFGAGT